MRALRNEARPLTKSGSHRHRRRLLGGLASLALIGPALTFAPNASAESDYPTKPVRLIVPYAPGGFSDVVARAIAPELQKSLGQPVVIDNRGGANGVIGTAVVAQARPDGYTLLLALDSHASNQSLYKSLPYDSIKDFAPILFLGTAPMVMIANKDFGPSNAAELVKQLKAAPDSVSYASLGPGSQIQLAARMLENSAGVRMTPIPYKGGAPALTDLMGGHIQVMFASATSATPLVEQHRVKAIGVASAKRISMLPDVPTFAEQGYPDVQMGFWVGLMARAGTPPEVVEKIRGATMQALSQPEVAKQLRNLGLLVEPKGPPEFSSFLAEEVVRWGDMLKRENVKPSD